MKILIFILILLSNNCTKDFKKLSIKYKDLNSDLMKAIEEKDKNKVLNLLNKGANCNYKDNNGNTPLMKACENGNLEIAKLLIEKGANVNDKNKDEKDAFSPLFYASKNGHLEIVKLLVEKGANINYKNNYNNTAVMWSCHNGHLEVAKFLIENGADINIVNNYKNTALTWAMRENKPKIVKLLIERGAYADYFDRNGNTALIWSCENGHSEIVESLLEKGADINCKDKGKEGYTALIWASRKGNLEIVKLLLNRDAKLDVLNNSGNTALMWACENNHLKIAKLLIERGANVNNVNNAGNTVLVWAMRRNNLEIVKLLIANGAKVDFSNYFNIIKAIREQGLSNANINRIIKIVEELIIDSAKEKNLEKFLIILNNSESRINLNAKDEEGNTVAHYLCSFNSIPLFNTLMLKGCNLNIINNRGETPLYYTLSENNFKEDFIIYLLNKGAILKPKSYINGRALVDVIAYHKRICNKLVYEPLTNKLLENNSNKIILNGDLKNKIEEIIKILKLKDEDFEKEELMLNFIRKILLDFPSEINLDQIVIKEDDSGSVNLIIEIFDEIFQHFEDGDYWDSIIKKAVEHVKESYIKDLDKISLDYLDCAVKKGLDYAKSEFKLDEDKKFNINRLIKEKINYIKKIFKDRLEILKDTKPVNKPLVEMSKEEREQNTDFQRKKQLAKLLETISKIALKGRDYDKIKYSINQILDAMVCREGSLEALNEAIRYILSGEIMEVDQSVKEVFSEELMKLRYELFKEVVNEEINKNKIKLSISLEGQKIQIRAEMVPELLPSILKAMYCELKIKLNYLDADDNYSFVYDKNYIVEEIKRRYKDRIVEYIKDIIEEEDKNEKEKSRILWNRVRDYIERNIFEGRPVLQIEDFVYDEDYKIKNKSVEALLIHLNFMSKTN